MTEEARVRAQEYALETQKRTAEAIRARSAAEEQCVDVSRCFFDRPPGVTTASPSGPPV